MKAATLFGIKFITNGTLKAQLLDNFSSLKLRKATEAKEQFEATALLFGKLFGNSEEDMKAALKEESPYKDVDKADFSEVSLLLKEDGCKHYFITQSVLTMCKKIRVKEPYDLEALIPIKDGKRQLNFGYNFIRYNKTGPRIVALMATATPQAQGGRDYLQYSFFSFKLDTKHVSKTDALLDDYDEENITGITDADYDLSSKKMFFQLVTFMQWAGVEEILVKPGQKHGTRKSEDQLLNETRIPITIVNTNWHKTIRTEGFDVNGHVRKQRCGPGLTSRRFVWIDPYHKNGYNLSAGKLRDDQLNGQSGE